MTVLAFDTCLAACSVALIERRSIADAGPGRVLARDVERMETGHAERLMPMIQALLSSNGLAVKDLSGFAVTVGPGTFTGVRLGVAAARGLALPFGQPVFVASSLALVAAGAVGPGSADAAEILVLADARNGEVIAGRYRLAPDGLVCEVDPPALMTLADAGRRVGLGDIVAGPKAVAVAELASSRPGRVVALEPEAAAFARVVWQRADPPVPIYTRPPDAKPQPQQALPRAVR